MSIARNMKRFLQFINHIIRLGCHKLPIATGRRTGVARAGRLCTFCDAGAVGDEKHLVFECAHDQLAPLWAKYADLFNDNLKDHTTRSVFAQRDHLRVFHHVRLLEVDGQIVIAAMWHMRSALLQLAALSSNYNVTRFWVVTRFWGASMVKACKIPFSGSSRPLSVTVFCTVVAP